MTFNERLFVRRQDSSPRPPGATDHFLQVDEGVSIHARAHWSRDARATFVVFHGNADVVSDYDALRSRYSEVVRANLIVVGYRGYGLSGGSPTFRNCIGDAGRALQELRAALGSRLCTPLIALGRSLGGACAAELAGLEDSPVDGVVLESAPHDLMGIVRRRGLPPPKLLSEADLAVFDPKPKLGRSRLPILVLHGSRDTTIRPHEARANRSMLRHPRSRLAWVEGRHHGDVLFDDAYYRELGAFADSVVEAAASPLPELRGVRERPLGALQALESRYYAALDWARGRLRQRGSSS